jgi:hypothetical protein
MSPLVIKHLGKLSCKWYSFWGEGQADVDFVSCYYDKDRPKASVRIRLTANEKGQEILNHVYGGEKIGSPFENPFDFCGGPLSHSISMVSHDFVRDLNEYVVS